MIAVVKVIVTSETMTIKDLRDFVEKHVSFETKARMENKNMSVHVETEEWE